MNKYLEKIAALNPAAKVFARKVINGLGGDSAKINNMYGLTSGVVNKNMAGVLSGSEKTNIVKKLGDHANKTVGAGKVYPLEAVRAARTGARLARMQSKALA